jgi:3-methyladenine DNA glycosylase Tag
MEITTKEERYEVNGRGELVVGIPQVTSNRKKLVENLFSQFGWKYELLSEITQQRKQHMTIFGTTQVFTRCSKELREQTYKVINPHTLFGFLRVL